MFNPFDVFNIFSIRENKEAETIVYVIDAHGNQVTDDHGNLVIV